MTCWPAGAERNILHKGPDGSRHAGTTGHLEVTWKRTWTGDRLDGQAWQEECRKRDWTSIPIFGDAYAKYVENETTRIEAILKDLGLA